MAALGVEVIRTPAGEYMPGAIESAEQIARDTPGAYLPNQFANPVNPQVHYETTGPEIFSALGDAIDAFVVGVGTTGTFTGVSRFLRERSAGLLRVAAEPQGSILKAGNADRTRSKGSGCPSTRPSSTGP